MDVDVGGVRRPPCGIPTQKLQLLEHLFNWRRGQSKQYFFKPLFLSLMDLVYFFFFFLASSSLPPQILAPFRIKIFLFCHPFTSDPPASTPWFIWFLRTELWASYMLGQALYPLSYTPNPFILKPNQTKQSSHFSFPPTHFYSPLTLLFLCVIIFLVNDNLLFHGVGQQLKGVHHFDISPLLLSDQSPNH